MLVLQSQYCEARVTPHGRRSSHLILIHSQGNCILLHNDQGPPCGQGDAAVLVLVLGSRFEALAISSGAGRQWLSGPLKDWPISDHKSATVFPLGPRTRCHQIPPPLGKRILTSDGLAKPFSSHHGLQCGIKSLQSLAPPLPRLLAPG